MQTQHRGEPSARRCLVDPYGRRRAGPRKERLMPSSRVHHRSRQSTRCASEPSWSDGFARPRCTWRSASSLGLFAARVMRRRHLRWTWAACALPVALSRPRCSPVGRARLAPPPLLRQRTRSPLAPRRPHGRWRPGRDRLQAPGSKLDALLRSRTAALRAHRPPLQLGLRCATSVSPVGRTESGETVSIPLGATVAVGTP